MRGPIVITQGEYHASNRVDDSISTLLGSCIACCLWDPAAAVGGMNHILLASRTRNMAQCDLAGVNAMELLINAILKLGGRRERLLAKVFGGAQMIDGLSEIGPANCLFAETFLEAENIPCVSKSLGGDLARQVLFTPTTGAVRVKAHPKVTAEPRGKTVLPKGNGLELF